jgi:hypothetical protein
MHCRIGLVKPNNRISTIYVHALGELHHTGRILFRKYNSDDLVEKLVSTGSYVIIENIWENCVLLPNSPQYRVAPWAPAEYEAENFDFLGTQISYIFMDGIWYFARNSDKLFYPLANFV